MSERPVVVMRVGDLAASVAFYGGLGFALVEERSDQDVALIRTPRGASVLLAGPAASDLTAYLAPGGRPLAVGVAPTWVYLDVDGLRATLAARGIVDTHVVELPWGERRLSVPGPDGYRVVFASMETVEPSAEEWFALYRRGADELPGALAGLSGGDLDSARAPGQWTIRQIVHHVADADLLWTTPIKVALATPGRVCVIDFYRDNDEWPMALAYADRPVEPGAALFVANRRHLADLLERLPSPWERHAQIHRPGGQEPERHTVAAMVRLQARHAIEHIEEIREIRRTHGC